MSRFARAYVTGASSGIGQAVSRLLCSSGVEVVLAARRREELERLASQLEVAGSRAHVEVLDVADPERARESVRAWDERLGGLDLVLASAGTAGVRRAGHTSWESLERVIRVNLLGACATLTAAAEVMAPRGRGALAAVTSLAGLRGMPGSGTYSASKAGLIAFLETLRADFEPRGLDVTEVRPGFVRTAMTDENEFRMPFLIELPDAARRIVGALEGRSRVCAFPWPLALPLAAARCLPAGVWNAFARRVHPRRDR